MVGIVQLARAPDCGSGDRGFESHYPPHILILYFRWVVAKSVKARDFDSRMRRFESCLPSHFEPLAQLVEHMTFNHGVRGSIPRWLTI